MTYSLTWLPEVLENAGLKVAETAGWRSRGRAEMGRVRGVMCHHTANPHQGNMPTLNMLINGRSDLPGPLCQLGLGRDGTFYVVAAGRANHAGRGVWEGIATGNSSFIGIEAEHSGDPGDDWPRAQRDAYVRGVAAILSHVGAGANMCCGHKEFAPNRKTDPTFDMAVFRQEVSQFLLGKSPPPLIKAVDSKNRPTLRRGARGEAVRDLQIALRVDPDGIFGSRTEAALRVRQRELGLVADGIAGPATWAVLTGEAQPPAPPAARPAPAAPAANGRRLGAKGTELIKGFESCEERLPDGRFKAYPDPGSRDGRPWTIGWGSTGPDVGPDTVWTQEECDRRFEQDIVSYVDEVAAAIGDSATTQNQFDALVSFHYNTGAIRQATLTRRHKAGDFAGAREAFAWWNKNDGKVMRGLVRRRKAEADLYAEA